MVTLTVDLCFLVPASSPLPSTNENIKYDSLAKGPKDPRSHGSTDLQKILLIAKLKQAKQIHMYYLYMIGHDFCRPKVYNET